MKSSRESNAPTHNARMVPRLVLIAVVGLSAACMPDDPTQPQVAEQTSVEQTPEQRAFVQEEISKWRGRWRCLSRNEEGNLVPQEEVAKISLTVGGTMYHFQWGNDFDEFGRYEFHPELEPKGADAHIEDPPEMKGTVLHLIYKLDGDRLVLSHREDHKRPTGFVAEPDSGQTVEVWERVTSATPVGRGEADEELEPEVDEDEPSNEAEPSVEGERSKGEASPQAEPSEGEPSKDDDSAKSEPSKAEAPTD